MWNTKEALFHGYTRGNYGNAYESEDWVSWARGVRPPKEAQESQETRDAYMAGCLLGFFSTYEDHEMPRDLANLRRYVRRVWASEIKKAGVE